MSKNAKSGAALNRSLRQSAATVLIGVCVACAGSLAMAQSTPGTIVGGSPDVMIGGVGAARTGDPTSAGSTIVTGSPNVFINGKPAVTSGDKTGCNGIVIGSAAHVFINGKPAARLGDKADCGAH